MQVQEKQEPTDKLDAQAHAVIGAAIEVHRVLGPGFLEQHYEEALCVELTLRGIPYQRQVAVALDFKGYPIGQGRLDLLICGDLVVELKAVNELAPIDTAQLIAYLKMTKHKLGLLLNFNVVLIKQGIKRIVNS